MFIGDNEIISGLDPMPVVVMEGQSTELQLRIRGAKTNVINEISQTYFLQQTMLN